MQLESCRRISASRGLAKSLLALLVAATCWVAPANPATVQDRVALVIGNAAYDHLPSLENPYNDAQGLAAALWQAGFETIELIDGDREEMIAAIATFAQRLRAGTDAVFFYAGHGVQSGGANYLLPVSTQLDDAANLASHAIDVNEIIGIMGTSEARINILILDACRDNPFYDAQGPSLRQEIAQIDPRLLEGMGRTDVVVRSSSGLAPLQVGRAETVVGYATGPGQVALDGEGANSPYTEALLQHINTPGLEIDMMLRRVRKAVREVTRGQQIPWMASTLESEFYFRPMSETEVASLDEALDEAAADDIRKLGLAPPRRLVEEAFWRVASAGGRREDFLAYLDRYPDGLFAAEARQRLDENGLSETVAAAAADSDDGVQVAYLGVGPVPIRLPYTLEVPPDVLGMRVAEVPTSGTFFRSDGTPVRSGHLLDRRELEGLRFLPTVGTRSTGVAEPLSLVPLALDRSAASTAWSHWVKSEIHPCDLLAGFRYAPDRVWDGVQQAILKLDPQAAIDACLLAVEQYPEVVRFAALLARAYRAAEEWEPAHRWAKDAAERGYAPGMSQLGTMYMRGNGVAPDYGLALALFEKAYELGNPSAAQRIGEMHEAGLGVPQDPARAAAWYRSGIELGNAFAATQLARLYERGAGVEKDMARAIALYEDAAAAGELSAQLRLARIYYDGIGRAPDPDKALEVLRAAAGTGMPTGQKGLGQFYEWQGQIDEAVFWYEKAHARGDPWAPLYLGRLYLDSASLGPDPQRAVTFLQAALERANGNAARDLAKLYESDRLGAPSPEAAMRYHRLAAEGGNIWSMRDLAQALLSSDRDPRNVAEGIQWLRRAADGGHPWAQRDLGVSLATGEPVERDPLEAARYLGLAAASEQQKAAEAARDALGKILSDRDRVLAAQTWLGQIGFDVGQPDGMAGPRTRAAVVAFAAEQGTEPAAADSPDLIAQLAPLVSRPSPGETAPASDGSSD